MQQQQHPVLFFPGLAPHTDIIFHLHRQKSGRRCRNGRRTGGLLRGAQGVQSAA